MKYVNGDIFSSPAKVIVNPVNTVGVMGKGLAATFKKKYPNMFRKYKESCENGSFTVGKLLLLSELDHDVLLFPTKKHWRGSSKIEYIEAGLQKFVKSYEKKNITSIAFPKLGCGLGSLSWDYEVEPLMKKYLDSLPIEIYVYLNVEKVPTKKSQLFTQMFYSEPNVFFEMPDESHFDMDTQIKLF